MWNWRKRKEENIDIKAVGSEHIQTRKNNNAGFTLVELMVSVAVFGLMVVPLMSGFVTANRINSKGRQKEEALTIAQDLMEGIKAFGLEDLAQQINIGPITIASNGSDADRSVSGTDCSGTASYVSGYYTTAEDGSSVYVASAMFVSNTYGGSVDVSYVSTYVDSVPYTLTEEVGIGKYVYILDDILMGNTYYDAYIEITQDKDPQYLICETSKYQKYFDSVSMNSMKLYDVEINVYISDEVDGSVNLNTHRASYTGTFFDNN